MNILSCFDGMSCAQIALNRAGIKVNKYYASEIDKYAIKVTQANYPNTIQLGSITEWKSWNIENPDLIVAGSPCQGFSFAGKQLNFNDERSKLFFTFAEILKHYKPKYFLLENVIMKKEYNDVISGLLGEIYPECVTQNELFRTGRLEPIEINSALLSAQNRRRLYWTNITGVIQPKDKGILLKDIIENNPIGFDISKKLVNGFNQKNKEWNGRFKHHKKPFDKKAFCLTTEYSGCSCNYLETIKCAAIRGRNPENPKSRKSGLDTVQMLEIRDDEKTNSLTSVQKDNVLIIAGYADIKGNDIIKRVYSQEGKAPTLTAIKGGNQEAKTTDDEITWRKLTPIECERLQTVEDNYTAHVSNSQRYKMLGNGFTVDVISHIFKGIKNANKPE